ncbi:MAG: hypothetical protein M3R60_06130 [Pseudomonadota bacterium]|nr:hypothetical protein [Pseudomonadota bacterium]
MDIFKAIKRRIAKNPQFYRVLRPLCELIQARISRIGDVVFRQRSLSFFMVFAPAEEKLAFPSANRQLRALLS